jgi:hypothetical protein
MSDAENSTGDLIMIADYNPRTARQAGWSMSEWNDQVVLYNDYGDYMEMVALRNADGSGIAFVRHSDTDCSIWDLPRSVLDLLELWLNVSIPFEVKKEI